MEEEKVKTVTLLDYGAGNVRSVRNAIRKLGYEVHDVTCADDIRQAKKLIFPGVGSFGAAVSILQQKGWIEPLREYVLAGRPFLGICIGLQMLFERSEESPGVTGLGVIPGVVGRFNVDLPVPHIGWNGVKLIRDTPLCHGNECVYFVHSYRVLPTPENMDWVLACTDYGENFISIIQKGAVWATQFHPEKSSQAGLNLIQNFLTADFSAVSAPQPLSEAEFWDKCNSNKTQLRQRVIACLDVRTNDAGDVVVTKGDQYQVRAVGDDGAAAVRNLGKPVELSRRYYQEGADEITFLNITGFRENPVEDSPMQLVLQLVSNEVFVPLTIGGGIRDYVDEAGNVYQALDVASQYFRSGADKVSIGSDAVLAAEEYYANGRQCTGRSCIEKISHVYGRQAVVVSIDPRRVYVSSPADTHYTVIELSGDRPEGQRYCWYQCTIKGGREGRDLDAIQLAQACEALGAGELLVNCIDTDGSKSGFDVDLLAVLSRSVSVPVIASSGAGCANHFVQVFQRTRVAAALAAGIFHRHEVTIQEVKQTMAQNNIDVRL